MRYMLFVYCAVLFFSCKQNRVTDAKDYEAFINPVHLQNRIAIEKSDLTFWQDRLKKDTGSYVNMLQAAYAHLAIFHLSGEIASLKTGDSLIFTASGKLNHSLPDIQQALSQVAITKHDFKNAAQYLHRAATKGSPYINALLNFDTRMETGEYDVAYNQISGLGDKNSFDYLIRLAKYEDHQGNLDKAIELMETAFAKVKDANVPGLYCWALANLGDMYGHAGRISDSYNAYLQVLRKDPAYVYALKGIAWIAYSHDRDLDEARRLINFILSQTHMPDLYLLLAELEEMQGNTGKKNALVQQFLSTVRHPAYGDMYNKYLIEIFVAENNLVAALRLAEKEVQNRPTPETYSWLAWVHALAGNKEKATAIYRRHVEGRSFEPDVLYKSGVVLAANGDKAGARKLFLDCLDASYELGPVTTGEIKKALQKL